MKMYVNHLPAETWNRLEMNGASLSVPAFEDNGLEILETKGWETSTTKVKVHEGLDPKDTFAIRALAKKGEIVTGVGPDMDRLIRENKVVTHSFKTSSKKPEPLIIDFDYGRGGRDLTSIEITVEDGVEATVVEEFTSGPTGKGVIGVQTKFSLGKGAKVTFVQVQDLNRKITFINDVGIVQTENAEFSGIEAILSGGNTYYGTQTNLYGKKSNYRLDIGYMVEDRQLLDMNIVAMHIGKKTNAEIFADGVLKDEAVKIFRSTVDFNAGCTGSSGEERENVLLMDDTVINKTVPLILCDEEDVEGAHGGSIGRLDDETLFYMMSRGMTKEEVYEMVSKARLDAVINKIPVKEIKDKWVKRLHPDED
ncbi:MAG: SufD family Fe-S cluster assembly protein [Lachnospiraceae bacterium]|nr:SufD family Fe-S cluster assembly protein [Lachnospiraceae bacterium]